MNPCPSGMRDSKWYESTKTPLEELKAGFFISATFLDLTYLE
jgi:hypothetical protein